MVKKGTKRKTRWRTLSIGDGGTDTSDTGITEIKQEQSECLTPTSNTNLSTFSRKSSSLTNPFHQRNGDRNHYYNRNSDKYPAQPHTRTQSHEENLHQHTPYPYKRRPFYQSSSSRFYGNINNKSTPSTNTNTNTRPYRSADTFDNKENTTTKPLFNEDDYTRITTPRQDVLFKKGYLSRPKKTITPIDTTVSSSTTVSVVSTEDSISSGTQSLSPEHCSSTPEIFDPDHPLMYPGFYDQNGLFYVNPFMPNGFDPYDGQMIMMPYGGSPFSINPSEYCNSESTAPYPQNHCQKRNSVDSENSPESPSSPNESASVSASSTPAIDDTSNEPSQNGDAPTESQSESDAPKVDGEATPNECNHNMPMQFYYPFMYGPPPPFLPINEMEYNDNMAQYGNSYGVKYNRFRKRKRRPFKWGNSTGVSATTTDYSEDEDSIEENNRLLDQTIQQSNIETNPCLTIAQCDDVISRTTLNTNVSEFVPRRLQSSPVRTTLNVEVEEFHPRNYTPVTVQSKFTDATVPSSKDTITKYSTQNPSPESQKVTILHRATTTVKCTQPTPNKMGNKDKAEQLNVQVSSAIDKSSTLISSISSRDKNDDNVNGVDNNKKIEKLVDPVNIKADLDVKVVMHPKQQENILENVKKSKFKNNKFSKSSPRKTNSNGHKKDVGKIGKGAHTNGKSESVPPPPTTTEHSQPMESKQNGVDDERIEKSNNQQPTYAQMVGPVVTKPKLNVAKPEMVHPIQENVEPLSADELKMFELIDEVKPEIIVKVETKWQTVRPKGKKKLFSVMCEETNDLWNDFDDEKSVEVKETGNIKEEVTAPSVPSAPSPAVEINEQLVTADGSMESAELPVKVKPSKTEKAKSKIKAKKSQKKIKEKVVKSNGTSESETTELNGTSTPKNDKMKSKSVTPIIDDLLFDHDGHEFLNDIDISNFNFETSPSMFVNAITNSGIYTDNSMTGKSNAGFALNNSLKLLNTFDFCKTKENVLLKEEEEMVIRVLKSLNQTDNQIVRDDISRCNNVIDDDDDEDDVKLNDVKIEKNIFDVVNGHHNGSHDNDDDDDKKNEQIIGAEILNVKCEVNGNGNGIMHKDTEVTNGHQTEDTNISVGQQPETETDDNETEINPKIEPIPNGNQLIAELILNNKKNGEEIDVCAQAIPDEVGADDGNDVDVTDVADKIETEMVQELTDQILVAAASAVEKEDYGVVEEDEEEDEGINKDCTSNIKSDDEAHSDLSELSDENDETVVSQSNDYFEYDEIETIKEIDVNELIEDLQFDDDADDFVHGNEDDVNARKMGNELQPEEHTMIQEILTDNEQMPRPSSQPIFIENDADISKTEITLNDIEATKDQDRIQSPRNSEDSGILESHDDGRYFSESDNDKTEQMPIQNFPLTEAVSRWLEEKQKEKSPEPIIRLPEDPELSQRIEKSIMNHMHISQFFDDYGDDDTTDESETEFEVQTASKNLISNPLRALFRRNDTTTSNHLSNGIRKRVANHNLESDKSSTSAAVTTDEPDILEYWENDPMLQSQNSNCNNVLNNKQQQQNCSSIDTELDAYESVYGKTIDYAKLTANIHNDDDDDVFLSNNILYNDKLSKLPINPINNNIDSPLLLQASSINGTKSDTNSIDKNLNCFKPPEICCMLM